MLSFDHPGKLEACATAGVAAVADFKLFNHFNGGWCPHAISHGVDCNYSNYFNYFNGGYTHALSAARPGKAGSFRNGVTGWSDRRRRDEGIYGRDTA